jgi:hypothetical protein
MLQLLLGQIPEAIFFALFMIYAKGLKEKRFLFTLLMVVEYVLLLNIFPYNFKFHISFMILTYLLLKMFYKEKCQITDVFILAIGYVILAISSIISFMILSFTLNNMFIGNILCKILMFSFIFVLRNKLNGIQNIYKKLWNRNDKVPKKMKTTTFRALNLVVFNILFAVLNLCMLYAIHLKGMR